MEPNKKNIPIEALFVLVVFILISFNLLGLSGGIAYATNTIFTPIMSIGSNFGSNIKVVLETIPSINEIRNERNDLLVENAKLKSKIATYDLLEDELRNLMIEYEFDEDVKNSISASILSWGYGNSDGSLILNRGTRDNVSKGDIVTLGIIYLGSISDVFLDTSSVMLPTNIKNSMKVIIIPSVSEITEMDKKALYSYIKDKNIKNWNAIAIGKNGVINLENIPKNSSVKVGDHVIIADEKINDYYYLGDISRVAFDPADVQMKAVVTQPFILNNLTNVFINRQSE